MTRHLVVLARLPRLGVKKRLASGIGAVPAWRFYRNTLRNMLRAVRGPWRCWLLLTPAARGLPHGWGAGWTIARQDGGDLGARMRRPFVDLPPGPVVLVGSDIPALGAHHVVAAFAALRRSDAAFGPAEDGGYWLVGLRRRRLARRLFQGVRWSTRHALADTMANLPRHCRVARLATLQDVDDAAAWRSWCAAARMGGAVAPNGLRRNPTGRARVNASGACHRGDAMR